MEEDEKPKKASAYSKRNSSNGVAAPVERESDDPDFNSGPIPKEEKKKTGRKNGKRQNRDSMDDLSDESDQPRKKKRKTKVPARKGGRPGNRNRPNPLLAFFKSFDPVTDSSDDEGPIDDSEATESDIDEGNKPNVPPNKFAAYARPKTSTSLPAGGTGETTEDDSDEELSVATTNRKPPPTAKRKPSQKTSKASTDSEATEPDSEATEPDSSSEPAPIAYKTKARPAPSPDSDPDKTESDSDDDQRRFPPQRKVVPKFVYPSADLRPRPGFPIPASQLLGPMILDEKEGIQVPAAINTYLRDYQRDGIKFFWDRYKEGRGGLLGDDMGLGKTIQVISFLSAIMKKDGVKTDRKRRREHISALQETKEWRKSKTLPPANATWPTCLIIAPSSVVPNWEREFKTWGYFEVLTSLDLARQDIEDLMDLDWSCIFVDEVHTVKNPASKTSLAYNAFECLCRFGLTGTAIQNTYDELWTILDWTNPGAVGTLSQWRSFVSKPLKNGQSTNAADAERARAVIVSEILRDKLLPQFFLRRTKDIIAHQVWFLLLDEVFVLTVSQLPKKTDEVVFCPLTASQIHVYKKILAMDELQNLLGKDDPCPCGSQAKQSQCCVPFELSAIFRFMSILIKLSNHLALILPTPTDTPEQLIRNRELAAVAYPDGDAPSYKLAILDPRLCGKWKVLLGLLKDWRKDLTNKVLIFTKSVKLLEMMAYQLSVAGYGFLQLAGSTKVAERMPIIDKFHHDPDVFIFLISTAAGGTGLNLVGANKVVIFDPNWSKSCFAGSKNHSDFDSDPAQDLQAMDRAFRFGQTRDVSVVRLLGAGSVEELIYARQIYKQQQMQIGYNASIQTRYMTPFATRGLWLIVAFRYFAGVQGDKSKQGELFGLKNIFKLHEGGLATKAAIEKAHIAELDWALSSMEPKGRSGDVGKVAEVESKLDKDHSDLKGLGALLLFDDDGPATASENTAKAAVRGMYTHLNPELLVASKIEQARTRNIVEQSRKKLKKRDARDKSPAAIWPPPRVRKNKGPMKIEHKVKALLGTRMITSASELPTFAQQFRTWSEEEQAYVLARLDEYRDSDSDSDGSQNDAREIVPEPEDIDMAD
ncbi:DNA excision repair protein ERCC-6-like 2 [Mycena sanguinolenta]|uniref:DNA excision repair protein ERCC-6-like 2 n=1 Tax=Mycena sanguinolenta TaxID=230812 RepID=A0A8H6ZCV6_9AGAR|nr:DNA excision repair protein ERCC-6-like 2 [Mycena sanguinolenta]